MIIAFFPGFHGQCRTIQPSPLWLYLRVLAGGVERQAGGAERHLRYLAFRNQRGLHATEASRGRAEPPSSPGGDRPNYRTLNGAVVEADRAETVAGPVIGEVQRGGSHGAAILRGPTVLIRAPVFRDA